MERRGFDIFHAVNFSVRPIEHIVQIHARARVSSRVSQVSSNFIPDAGYNTYVRLGLSTVIGFSSGNRESQVIGRHGVKTETQTLFDTRRAFVQ